MRVSLDWYTARSGTWLASVTGPWELTATTGIDRSSCSLRLRLDQGADWRQWSREIMRYAEPGRYALGLSTQSRALMLGDWVTTRCTWDTSSPVVTIEGRGWEDILGQQIWERTERWPRTAGYALGQCLEEATQGTEISVAVVEETPTMVVEIKAGELVSRTMESIVSAHDGAVWYMESTLSRSGDGGPAKIARRARVSRTYPRPGTVELVAGEPGTRRGNCTLTGGQDWTRYTTTVHGSGTGSGQKQLTSLQRNGRLVQTGILRRDETRSWGDVRDKAALAKLTRGALRDGQSLDLPMSATLHLAQWPPGLPIAPDMVSIRSGPTYGLPDGLPEREVMVTEASMTAASGELTKYQLMFRE